MSKKFRSHEFNFCSLEFPSQRSASLHSATTQILSPLSSFTSRHLQVVGQTRSESKRDGGRPGGCSPPPQHPPGVCVCGQGLPLVLVVLEFEVEASARLEGVKVERPRLLPSSPSLLVLRVQRILASIELLSHFWTEKRRDAEAPQHINKQR